MSKQYTKAEVAQHKDDKAMFIIIDDGVYDVAGMCFFLHFAYGAVAVYDRDRWETTGSTHGRVFVQQR
jgi:hypothetical protein